jgi:hypothetical protein
MDSYISFGLLSCYKDVPFIACLKPLKYTRWGRAQWMILQGWFTDRVSLICVFAELGRWHFKWFQVFGETGFALPVAGSSWYPKVQQLPAWSLTGRPVEVDRISLRFALRWVVSSVDWVTSWPVPGIRLFRCNWRLWHKDLFSSRQWRRWCQRKCWLSGGCLLSIFGAQHARCWRRCAIIKSQNESPAAFAGICSASGSADADHYVSGLSVWWMKVPTFLVESSSEYLLCGNLRMHSLWF